MSFLRCYGMSPEKCRSFNYDKDGSVCNLLYLDSKTTLRPQVKQGIDHYDLHCLGPAKGSSCLNKDGALYSRYLYTKQQGLPAKEFSVVSLSKCLDLCSENEVCEGVNYNRRNGNCAIFEKVEGDGAKSEHVDFYKNLCRVKETDNGASSAANVPPEVHISTNRTITTAVNKSEGHINNLKVTGKKGSTIHKAKEDHRRKEQQKTEAAAAAAGTSADASLSVSNSGKKALGGPPVLIPADAVHTICNYEGIKVQIKNQQPFSGIVFVKNKYDTCRVEVETSDSATLVIGLPTNFGMKPIVLNADGEDKSTGNDTQTEQTGVPASDTATEAAEPLSNNEVRRRREAERDCGLVDMDNGTYKTTVVVQTNNLGIPGLVTSMDQIYEISCDYSSMLGGKITAAANMTVHGPQPSLIQPRGKIELGNPVLMQMNSGSGGHQPVVQAKLGDILELRWEIMAMDEELDFFVRECTAEPGGSNGRSDEKLQLIENGCPTPAVSQKLIPGPIVVQSSAVKIAHLQAFRFDSSSSVRITCHLEICKGNCKPATCDLVEGQKESWGRKKRSDNAITEFETKRYKVPRFAQATTSLVVIDPLQQINEPAPSVSLSRQSPIDLAPEAEPPVLVERASIVGQMCMNKVTLLGVLGTLLSLILIQAIIVTKYIFQRIFSDAKKTTSSNFAY
ncbi:PAN domain-containing protein [Aphelenchoides avenae]|nr:PAN domain-containing protein [Aphelenchus avenae]